jgi:hypothetical protein
MRRRYARSGPRYIGRAPLSLPAAHVRRLSPGSIPDCFQCLLQQHARHDTRTVGFSLVDLIGDKGFESSDAGFAPVSPLDGRVARSASHPIAGDSSLRVKLNPYGRVMLTHYYGYGSGPLADSVTVASASVPTPRRSGTCP